MADTTVKFFHSAMSGAPTLSGSAGALIAVLDACLVNGFGAVTLDSIVVASNVATATRAAGSAPVEVGSVVLIAGATPSGLNGEKKVVSVTSTAFTFATTGISDQTAAGTITSKLSPAGWAKTFSGTNKAAYKPTDPAATGCLLRVDDTGTTNARVVGYETMSDVDSGTGPFPTSVQRTGGSYWTKSATANGTARGWVVIADGRTVYVCREYHSTSYPNAYEISGFGDFTPTKSGDAYACFLNGTSIDEASLAPTNSDCLYFSNGATALETYCPRSYLGVSGAKQMIKNFPVLTQSGTGYQSGTVAGGIPYPNPADGGLYVVPMYLSDSGVVTYRGTPPGIYCCPQSVPDGVFAIRDTLTAVAGLPGKTLKIVTSRNSVTTPHSSPTFFDVTGPWR